MVNIVCFAAVGPASSSLCWFKGVREREEKLPSSRWKQGSGTVADPRKFDNKNMKKLRSTWRQLTFKCLVERINRQKTRLNHSENVLCGDNKVKGTYFWVCYRGCFDRDQFICLTFIFGSRHVTEHHFMLSAVTVLFRQWPYNTYYKKREKNLIKSHSSPNLISTNPLFLSSCLMIRFRPSQSHCNLIWFCYTFSNLEINCTHFCTFMCIPSHATYVA